MNSSGIEALTLPALSLALDAAVMRQQVIASNIANAHTEGYVAQRVSFEAAMDAASGDVLRSSDSTDLRLTAYAYNATTPSIDGAVRLDSEVAAMSQNGAHYQALLKALNRHLSVMASAVSEGKR